MKERKTKIVATIGRLAKYRARGVYDLSCARKQTGDITLESVIGGFLENGVNIIRLNMAHVTSRMAVRRFFQALRAVGRHGCNVAVLADLEGPKIRFRTPGRRVHDLSAGDGFVVSLRGRHPPGVKHATVYVDDRPLGIRFPSALRDVAEATVDRRKQIFVGDGEVVLRAAPNQTSAGVAQTGWLQCVVLREGLLEDESGFTVREGALDIPTYTQTDARKLRWLLREGFGRDGLLAFIGLSFTQSAERVMRLKYAMEQEIRNLGLLRRGSRHMTPVDACPFVVAKIETMRGLDNAKEILKAADALMVARGDLGVQLRPEEVPAAQRWLLHLCRRMGKPVITATQMLKSMVDNFEPSRAEVNDVFQAILDGSDAVMLSEETAKGRYPFHAVRAMADIALRAEDFIKNPKLKKDCPPSVVCDVAIERHQLFLQEQREFRDEMSRNMADVRQAAADMAERLRFKPGRAAQAERRFWDWAAAKYQREGQFWRYQAVTDRITQSACVVAEQENAEPSENCSIVATSATGRTVRMIARFRPTVRVVGAAHDALNARKLALSYGVVPMDFGLPPEKSGPVDMFKRASRVAVGLKILDRGDMVVFVSGTHPAQPGTTNTIQLRSI